MAANGKSIMASYSDSEALAIMKPCVLFFNSAECSLKNLPEQFIQPSEAQSAYDSFKVISDAAHPGDSKQTVNERIAKRKVFNEAMGSLIDLVALASQKDANLPAQFGMDFLGQGKPKQVTRLARIIAPLLAVKAIDKEPGIVRCKVRGGVKRGVEIHHTYDDPSNEANWQHFDSFVNAAFSMEGLASGRRTYLRGRYLMAQGKKGPWSDMVSIMVP